MSEHEKAIDLVKKILAKATNNNNEHEIEVANLKAQEILAKHGLCMEDVDDSDKPKVKEVKREVASPTLKKCWWVRDLCGVIARNFRCEHLIHYVGKTKEYISFIGLKEDVKIAKEVSYFTVESLDILSHNYIVGLCNEYNNMPHAERPKEFRKFVTLKDLEGAKNDYINGFIKGLSDKYDEQVEKNDWGLILVKDDAVVQHIKNMHLKSAKPLGANFSHNSTHYGNGYEDGKSSEYNKRTLK